MRVSKAGQQIGAFRESSILAALFREIFNAAVRRVVQLRQPDLQPAMAAQQGVELFLNGQELDFQLPDLFLKVRAGGNGCGRHVKNLQLIPF